MSRVRVALHLHTNHSPDSNWAPADVLQAAEREGLDWVAITDHDAIGGALEARRLGGPVRVIIGEEISSGDGHIIGLFLREEIEPGLPGEATIARIHEQGGLAIAAHPLATLCEDSLGGEALERLSPWLDAVEVHNALNILPWEDRRAARFARRRGLPACAGCDTHVRGRLGPAWQEMADFDGPGAFLHALRSAGLVRGRHSLAAIARMSARHLWDKLSPWPLPGYGVNARPPLASARA